MWQLKEFKSIKLESLNNNLVLTKRRNSYLNVGYPEAKKSLCSETQEKFKQKENWGNYFSPFTYKTPVLSINGRPV